MDKMIELKAKAYDLIAIMERARKELDAVNIELAKLASQPKEEEKKEG